MPTARDYVCTTCHHEWEHFEDHFSNERPCVACEGGSGKWVPTFGRSGPREAQGFTPVVVHRSADGSIRFPGSADAPVPMGFERVALTTVPEIRAFEKTVNAHEGARIREATLARQRQADGQIAHNRKALFDKSAVGHTFDQWSTKGREFYDRMREVSDKRRAETAAKSSRQEAGFHIEAFSQNSSNRIAHRDASNDWGRSGRGK